MIDELDVFHATVTLALARAARLPGQVSIPLANAAAELVSLPPEDRTEEQAALHRLFGRRWYPGKPADSLFRLYQQFWDKFPPVIAAAKSRVTVNAPQRSLAGRVSVVTDPRLGSLQALPEMWAFPSIDDATLYAEDGWSEADQVALADRLEAGSTIHLVRPGERCNFWFEAAQVRHNFRPFFDALEARGALEPLHASAATEPVMLTIFGVREMAPIL